MPRRPRIIVPGIPLHLIQRGNNRQACFFADADYLTYLDWLDDYAKSTGCLIHAFVLMTNHVHLLLTPEKQDSAGNLMKRLGQRYVQYINRSYRRSGTLWEGRFRSCIVQQEEYLFSCQRYIEMNPVRAGIIQHPDEYQWSSYQANGLGKGFGFIHHHSLYQDLGEPIRKGRWRIGHCFATMQHQEKLIKSGTPPMEILRLAAINFSKKLVNCWGGVRLQAKPEDRKSKMAEKRQNKTWSVPDFLTDFLMGRDRRNLPLCLKQPAEPIIPNIICGSYFSVRTTFPTFQV
jgi:putative transposase